MTIFIYVLYFDRSPPVTPTGYIYFAVSVINNLQCANRLVLPVIKLIAQFDRKIIMVVTR